MSQKKEVKTEKDSSLSPEIKKIIENITKEYGEGTITTLGKSKLKEQKILSTGSLLLDQAIGTGGYVCGKIVEIYGLESSGKSTLSLHAVRECQKLQKKAVYIDLENGLIKVNTAFILGILCSRSTLYTVIIFGITSYNH